MGGGRLLGGGYVEKNKTGTNPGGTKREHFHLVNQPCTHRVRHYDTTLCLICAIIIVYNSPFYFFPDFCQYLPLKVIHRQHKHCLICALILWDNIIKEEIKISLKPSLNQVKQSEFNYD